MNKRLLCIWAIAIALTMMFASTALASGYPMIAGDMSSGVLVVGKFDSNSFTLSEANQIAATVAGMLGMLGEQTQFFGPSQVGPAFGISDGDAVKSAAKSAYQSYGFDVYIFLDIKRVGAVSQDLGQNLRIDVWVADMAAELGIPGDYLYAASIEAPEMYLSMVGELGL
jgi:hypothetical protein